jgi:hypothetical protein
MAIGFYSKGEDLESNVETINEALDFLKNFNDHEKLIESDEAAAALDFIYKFTAFKIAKTPKLIVIYTEKNLLQLLFNLTEYFSIICGDLKHSSEEDYTNLDSQKNKCFWYTVQILNFLSIYSLKLRLNYFEMGGTKPLLKILENEKYAMKFQNEDTFTRVGANINWLSKNADLYKSEWNELNAVDTLLKVSRNYRMSKLVAYMTFANIANDKQIDTLTDIHEIISELTSIINKAAENMKTTKVIREKQPFIEEDETTNDYDVYIVPVEEYDTRFTVTGVLLALYKLSVNNTIKYDMYVKYKIKEPLSDIILTGSEIEKKYSLQLLAQLCFDDQVLDIVTKDVELRKYIEDLTKPENCSMKTMRKLCEQIKWAIYMKNKKQDEETTQRLNESHQQKQVMISYNSASRDLCMKVKEELEKNGFRIWIDVNEIHGSSLESMARAVESSDFVLMCVTEKYRQSVNCQAEAQYAFKLKKKIVPLIMQKGYENVDGWLGIIMGDKIFVNFNKHSFEQCITIMLKELNLSINQSNKIALTLAPPVPSVGCSSAPLNQIDYSARNWNEKQINDWFVEKKVPQHVMTMLNPCNGEVLYQLYRLRSSAPEFYFQSITKDSNLDLKSVLSFSLDLEKLFEN